MKTFAKWRDGQLPAPATVPVKILHTLVRFFTGGCMGPRVGLDAVEKADSPIRSLVTVPNELPGCLRSRSALPFPFAFFARSTFIGVQSSDSDPVSETFISEITPPNANVYTYTVTSLTGCYIRT